MGISGVRGLSSGFGLTGRGDNGGGGPLDPGLTAAVAYLGGSKGLDRVGGGTSSTSE